jgi:phasin family protein
MAGLTKVGSAQQLVETETEMARKAFDAAMRQMQELAEIVTDANLQATEAIVRRIPDSLDEIKDLLKAP